MDFSASAATKDAARTWRRRSCTPPRFSSTLPDKFPLDRVERCQQIGATLLRHLMVLHRNLPLGREHLAQSLVAFETLHRPIVPQQFLAEGFRVARSCHRPLSCRVTSRRGRGGIRRTRIADVEAHSRSVRTSRIVRQHY